MGQMRLSGLEIISIERNRAMKLDTSFVTRNAAESEAPSYKSDKHVIRYATG
jgi:hypothetical protein